MLSDKVYDGNQQRNTKEMRQKVHDAADVINNENRCIILNMYGTFRSQLTKVLIRNGNIVLLLLKMCKCIKNYGLYFISNMWKY